MSQRPGERARRALPSPKRFEHRVPPRSESLSTARTHVRDVLESWLLPELSVEDLVLIHSELVSNAIQQGPSDPVMVAISWDGDKSLTVEVTNTGSRHTIPDREAWRPSSLLSPTGRGLQIIGALSESVEVIDTGNAISVVVSYRCS